MGDGVVNSSPDANVAPNRKPAFLNDIDCPEWQQIIPGGDYWRRIREIKQLASLLLAVVSGMVTDLAWRFMHGQPIPSPSLPKCTRTMKCNAGFWGKS